MMTKVHGKHVFECDTCAAILDSETRDFHEALDVLNEHGWRSVRSNKEWEHRCPRC